MPEGSVDDIDVENPLEIIYEARHTKQPNDFEYYGRYKKYFGILIDDPNHHISSVKLSSNKTASVYLYFVREDGSVGNIFFDDKNVARLRTVQKKDDPDKSYVLVILHKNPSNYNPTLYYFDIVIWSDFISGRNLTYDQQRKKNPNVRPVRIVRSPLFKLTYYQIIQKLAETGVITYPSQKIQTSKHQRCKEYDSEDDAGARAIKRRKISSNGKTGCVNIIQPQPEVAFVDVNLPHAELQNEQKHKRLPKIISDMLKGIETLPKSKKRKMFINMARNQYGKTFIEELVTFSDDLIPYMCGKEDEDQQHADDSDESGGEESENSHEYSSDESENSHEYSSDESGGEESENSREYSSDESGDEDDPSRDSDNDVSDYSSDNNEFSDESCAENENKHSSQDSYVSYDSEDEVSEESKSDDEEQQSSDDES